MEKGSEVNAPLVRAILGGLIAGGPVAQFVVPTLFTLTIHCQPSEPRTLEEAECQLELPDRAGGDEEGSKTKLLRAVRLY
jgi:hypothetical protein